MAFVLGTNREGTESWPKARSRFQAPVLPMLKLCVRRKFWVAASASSRFAKTLDAATRTIPGARWREDKSLLDTVVNLTEFPSVDPGQFRPRVPGVARRSPGHGDARSSEIFCSRRCKRQAAAAFSGSAEYRWRPARHHSPWPRTRAASAVQRCPVLLADRSEASAA